MSRIRPATVCVLIVSLVAGCGSLTETPSYSQETSHLRWLLRLYTQAMSRGKAPKSEADFKAYINGLDSETRNRIMEGAEVSTVDELFTSERDGEPYVFFYGQRPAGVANDLLAYERTGLDGKRYVGYGLGNIEEVDEQRFAELVPPASRPAK